MSIFSILIVDDSPSVHLLFGAYLRAAGYTDLLTAASAQDAFDHLGMDGLAGGEIGIDLILMDITMPEIDGIEACRRIKADTRLREIPIIVVTEIEEIKYLDEAFAAGALDYMTKSVTKLDLIARVRSALALKREADARGFAYVELVDAQNRLEVKNQKLQAALAQVKLLSGLLPICCYCKKIRNDVGYLQQIETYIAQHSEAEFTQCMCPDCMEELHPNVSPQISK